MHVYVLQGLHRYVFNAAFLATIYSDYLEATNITEWHCGSNYYSTDVLRQFANTQCDSQFSFFSFDCILHHLNSNVFSTLEPYIRKVSNSVP